MTTATAAMITLTDAAAERVKKLIANSEKPVLGLRVGVNSRGCSGLSYVVEYAEEQKRFEDVVEDKGVKIFIDPTAVMFLIGSEMGLRGGQVPHRLRLHQSQREGPLRLRRELPHLGC